MWHLCQHLQALAGKRREDADLKRKPLEQLLYNTLGPRSHGASVKVNLLFQSCQRCSDQLFMGYYGNCLEAAKSMINSV